MASPFCRGFITLSQSLGLMATALHAALLQSLAAEGDPGVLLCALRALGMLLLAAPYHRLPQQLLPRCVQVRWGSPYVADWELAAVSFLPHGILYRVHRAWPTRSTLFRIMYPGMGGAAPHKPHLPCTPLHLQGLQTTLQQAVARGSSHSPRSSPRLSTPLPPECAPLAAACLSCLAAAFGTKQPIPALAEYLGAGARPSSSGSSSVDGSSSGRGRDSGTATGAPGPATAVASSAVSGGPALVRLLFGCASCGSPAVELEAVLALRGLAQQYSPALEGQWDAVLRVAQAGVAVAAQMVPQSPRSQQGAAAETGAGGGVGHGRPWRGHGGGKAGAWRSKAGACARSHVPGSSSAPCVWLHV